MRTVHDSTGRAVEALGAFCDTRRVYSEAVLDHFQHPRNAGDLAAASAVVEVNNPVCGDVLRLAIRVEDGRILEARFQTRGCVTSIASSSLLTEMLLGKTLAEARAITAAEIAAELGGLPPATYHGSQLAAEALALLLAGLK
jgi:nitrogen fixation NifU-like protein